MFVNENWRKHFLFLNYAYLGFLINIYTFLLELHKKSEYPILHKTYPKPVIVKPDFFEAGPVFFQTGYPTGFPNLSQPDFIPDFYEVTNRSPDG